MNVHAEDALSALLDGELTDVEAADVRAHIERCAVCALELDTVREARELVRSLPEVEPPAGWIDELITGGEVIRLEPRRRAVMANVIVSVAAGLVVMVLAANLIGPAKNAPGVTAALERHASTVSALGDIFKGNEPSRFAPDEPAPPTTAAARNLDDLPGTFDAPGRLAGYRLIEAYRTPDGGVHLLYGKGKYALSVFERKGGVDWDQLPSGGARIDIADHRGWRWNDAPANGRLLVIEEDDITITIVGDQPGDAVLDVAVALPSSHSLSMSQRVTRAVAKALELFSPAP